MRGMKRTAYLMMFLMVFVVAATADVIHVPEDQPTIQDGIDEALNGDTVLVADGIYTGVRNKNLDYAGKAITVMSENGAENCIIDCEDDGRGCLFDDGEDLDSVFRGFTIQNGYAGFNASGGGILCTASSPHITECWILDNVGKGGGGFHITNSQAVISNCLVKENRAQGNSGAGIRISPGSGMGDGDVTIANCVIVDNETGASPSRSGGGLHIDSTDNTLVVRLFNCLIANNTATDAGGTLCCRSQGTSVIIENCTIVGNDAPTNGGIHAEGGEVTVKDSIIWGNTNGQIAGSVSVTYSDIEGGYTGTGNINADPIFVTETLGMYPPLDYYLSQIAAGQAEESPCANTGSDLAEETCLTTEPFTLCMSQLTTRTDHFPDIGVVDMGYHYSLANDNTVAAELTCLPYWGTVPFAVDITVTLTNRTRFIRRIAGQLDVDLAGGQHYQRWRAGYANVVPGSSYETSWPQMIPALASLIGENVFTLSAEDVTFAPYNLPPYYPLSGDTDISSCTVLGLAP